MVTELQPPLAGANCEREAKVLSYVVDQAERQSGQTLDRAAKAKLAHSVWRDAGAVKADRIRFLFIRTANAAGLGEVTCPKSFRHSFATLLQDANVDLLIRQVTLGHASSGTSGDALGMTSIYAHTRPETQRNEIIRELRLWPDSLKLAESFAHGMEPRNADASSSITTPNHEEEKHGI